MFLPSFQKKKLPVGAGRRLEDLIRQFLGQENVDGVLGRSMQTGKSRRVGGTEVTDYELGIIGKVVVKIMSSAEDQAQTVFKDNYGTRQDWMRMQPWFKEHPRSGIN